MRLTLRTLLAYLDNTLDPQDAEALRQKLTDSAFATQLVQRIRDSLESSFPAPSPEALGPVEDANLISEYLDSTLTAEQVAEIERACLESGPHLAEAAACHQILTMALGKSAEVPTELRNRIYDLPRHLAVQNTNATSFSGISLPVEGQSLLDLPTEELAKSFTPATSDSDTVPPVGIHDSGVSDAPTRLKEAEQTDTRPSTPTTAKPALAGSKSRTLDDSIVYGGTFRPSRIAPWLVSLALVAALGFAVVRIFEPLWNPQQVAEETTDDDSTRNSMTDRLATLPETPGSDEPDTAANDESSETERPSIASEPEAPNSAPPEPSTSEPSTSEPSTPEPSTPEPSTPEPSTPEPAPPSRATDANIPAAVSPNPANGSEPAMTDMETDAVAPSIPPPTDQAGEENAESLTIDVATLMTDSTFVAAKTGETWEQLKQEDVIRVGIPLVFAPSFRAELSTEHATLAFVGPTQAAWDALDPNLPVLQLDTGQFLIKSTATNKLLHVRLGKQPVVIRLANDQTAVAVSVQQERGPGLNPLEVENHRAILSLLTLQGEAEVTCNGGTTTLAARQQWMKRGLNEPQITTIESDPAWLNPDNDDPLRRAARKGLMGLIGGAQPLEIELQEARLFRRMEVGALAAETLLQMGYGDVYFGGDGILSDPKQRPYWSDHFSALQATVNQSVDSATNLRRAMNQMDSANALPLFRLLTGFSQKQLVEGGDEELVNLLDSPSMAVRVLALENLKAITGTTSNFRPDQENAIRRAPGIKTWVARQRKGDIRWQE